jgi:DNA-binding MarR family transcriptional regulator
MINVAKRKGKHAAAQRQRKARAAPLGGELGLDDIVGYNLRRAHGIQRHRFAFVFGPYGIRPVLLSILGLIYENPALKQSELGKRLDIKRANIVTLLGELEQRGLVMRQLADTDRRAYVLGLTSEGKKLTSKVLGLHARLEEDMVRGFGLRERDQLLLLLKKFRGLDSEPNLGGD